MQKLLNFYNNFVNYNYNTSKHTIIHIYIYIYIYIHMQIQLNQGTLINIKLFIERKLIPINDNRQWNWTYINVSDELDIENKIYSIYVKRLHILYYIQSHITIFSHI